MNPVQLTLRCLMAAELLFDSKNFFAFPVPLPFPNGVAPVQLPKILWSTSNCLSLSLRLNRGAGVLGKTVLTTSPLSFDSSAISWRWYLLMIPSELCNAKRLFALSRTFWSVSFLASDFCFWCLDRKNSQTIPSIFGDGIRPTLWHIPKSILMWN